jgi:hypothetical protein
MKKFYIFLMALVSINIANAQGCLPEGIEFKTQAQIDSFQINYPGCTKIEGNVSISQEAGNNPITNLNGLNVLTSIGGDLFYGATAVSDFTGLDNLTSIGGNLYLTYPPVSLAGMDNLTTIGGDMVIGSDWQFFYGTILTSLMGLHSLTSIGGDFKILKNNVLENLSGLENLTTIGGGIRINQNYSLTSLSGLDNIKEGSITSIYICHNNSLSACNVQGICNYLASPNGTVDIHTNAYGCNDPAQIASGCGISLPCLPYGNYWFFSQDEIDHFKTDYQGCTEVKGNVTITGLDISNLNGLSGVTSIVGSLQIGLYDFFLGVGNPLLTSLTGLENLKYIDGNLLITENHVLITLAGLDNLTAVGGDVLIGIGYVGSTRDNAVLASLSGLQNLTTVGGELYISNSAITSLSGLDRLISIGGGLTIAGHMSLISLTGLDNLMTIRGDLHISSNPVLSSLAGLDNITAASINNLKIIYNDSLSNCAVRSICDYLASPNGVVDIGNNATGCSGQWKWKLRATLYL